MQGEALGNSCPWLGAGFLKQWFWVWTHSQLWLLSHCIPALPLQAPFSWALLCIHTASAMHLSRTVWSFGPRVSHIPSAWLPKAHSLGSGDFSISIITTTTTKSLSLGHKDLFPIGIFFCLAGCVFLCGILGTKPYFASDFSSPSILQYSGRREV